jgi:hypothetical protein
MEAGFSADQIDTSRAHPARMYDYYSADVEELADSFFHGQVADDAPEKGPVGPRDVTASGARAITWAAVIRSTA